MHNQYELVAQLVVAQPNKGSLGRMLNDFAHALGWRPSDWMELPDLSSIATAHLLVEHGLENSAVISFLRSPQRFDAPVT